MESDMIKYHIMEIKLDWIELGKNPFEKKNQMNSKF